MKNRTVCYYDFEATGVSRDTDMISVGLVAVTETDCKRFVLEKIPLVFGDTPEERIKKHLEYLKEGIDVCDTDSYKGFEIKTFYAEFQDFTLDKCDDWVKENIVGKLQLDWLVSWWSTDWTDTAFETKCKGTKSQISEYIKQWLSQFEEIEFWADFDVIDKPMLIDLIADWNTIPYCRVCNQYGKEGCDVINKCVGNYVKIGLPKHLPNIKYDQFFDLHTELKLKGIDTDINRVEFIGDLINEIPEGQSHNALYDSYINWKLHQKLMSILKNQIKDIRN